MKALFFDFGDVLVLYDHMRSCRALASYSNYTPKEIYSRIFGNKLEELHYNRGEYTDEEWYQLCVRELNLKDCPYDVFVKKWGDIFSPNPNIAAVLGRVSLPMFVLSNTNGMHWQWARNNLAILAEYFSGPHQAILSSEEKCRKPETLIYQRALVRAGVAAPDAVFIDDKSENIEAFKRLGGHGIVYSAHSPNTQDLQRQLKMYGCLTG